MSSPSPSHTAAVSGTAATSDIGTAGASGTGTAGASGTGTAGASGTGTAGASDTGTAAASGTGTGTADTAPASAAETAAAGRHHAPRPGDADGGGVSRAGPGDVDVAGPVVGPGAEIDRTARRRPGRRAWIVLGVAVAALVGATAAAVAAATPEAAVEVVIPTGTAAVERRDLVATEEFDGDLSYATDREVATQRDGVVTAVAAAGSSVGSGGILYALDLEPTVVLGGAVPAYRALDTSSDGADVEQLERALTELGYGADLTVDTEFTAATADAVEDWESDLGRTDPDGTVELGDVVFADGGVRVARVEAPVGSQLQSGETVLAATSSEKIVTIDLDADRSGDVETGAAVTVTLPDGTDVPGLVSSVGTEPETDAADPEADPTVPVVVVLDDPATAAAFDSGGVTVTAEGSREEGVLAVPVVALVALAEGGYALEVTDAGGTRFVPVEVGTIADGWVAVTGEVTEGTEVVVPV